MYSYKDPFSKLLIDHISYPDISWSKYLNKSPDSVFNKAV